MFDNRKKYQENRISNKKFGLSFSLVFGIVTIWALLKDWPLIWLWMGLAILFFSLAYLLPKALRPLNQLWYWFGLLLQKITTPLILGIMFYLILFPISLLRRLFGKNEFRKKLKTDKSKSTYWISAEDKDTDFRHIF